MKRNRKKCGKESVNMRRNGKVNVFPDAIWTQTAAPSPTHGGLLPPFTLNIDDTFGEFKFTVSNL